MPDRVRGHSGIQSIRRVLHHRDPALRLDRRQPRRAVLERTGQHHTNYACAVFASDTPEHRIDCGPVPVLPWAAAQVEMALCDDQMPVGRSDVDPSGPDRLAVGGVRGLEAGLPAQDVG